MSDLNSASGFQCSQCELHFHSPDELKWHLSLHHLSQQGLYFCNYCGSTYDSNLRSEMGSHLIQKHQIFKNECSVNVDETSEIGSFLIEKHLSIKYECSSNIQSSEIIKNEYS